MPKVLISDDMSALARQTFEQRGIEVDVKTGLSPEALAAIIGGYDGLAIRSATKAKGAVLDAADNLKVIGRAGIGVDNVDLEAATARGIVVMNTPFGNAITTAEHAIAMMCALARQIPQADRSTRAGKWEKSRFMGVELCNKVLGMIGCGNIGSIVAALAQGLKMRVVVFDPYLSNERAGELGVEMVSLDDLLSRADVVTLHVPLTGETRHVLDADALAKMRPGTRIVNCARGGLIDEAALKSAIESGHIAGAALDVFEEEPARENALFALEEVVATPHLGASTEEAQENVARQIAEQMCDYLLSGAVTNAVNMPSVASEELAKLQPYMLLAEQLGSFAGQLTDSGLKAVTIEYEGQAASMNTTALTAVVLQGLLSPLLDSVNVVSAPVIARSRGIDVREVKREQSEDYQTLIRLTVSAESQTRSVAGTLVANHMPRIVEVKGIKVEAEVSPHMLYLTNEDKPGLIGAIGTVLGEENINIATFNLGRAAPGGDALSLVAVDAAVSDAVLKRLRSLPLIVQAKRLRF